MLSMKFHTKHVYDEKYMKGKVKTCKDVVNKIFWNHEI